MKRSGSFLWFCWGVILFVIVVLSCLSQPVFAEHYGTFLNWLPLESDWRRYLLSHYKLGHPFCYAILSILSVFCFKRYLLSLLLVFSLGAVMELVQLTLPTRSASWIDLMYDVVGILAGLALVFIMRWISEVFSRN